MMDAVERHWHTQSVCAAIRGDEIEDWGTVLERFDAYLADREQPLTEEQEKRRLLGLR
jgi:hypothetical protein